MAIWIITNCSLTQSNLDNMGLNESGVRFRPLWQVGLGKNFYSGNRSSWENKLLIRSVQDSLINENILI